MTEERFSFTAGAKKTLMILGIVGIVLFVIGTVFNMSGGHGHDEGHGSEEAGLTVDESSSLLASADDQHEGSAHAEPQHNDEHEDVEAAHGEHHETAHWLKRIYNSLWINNVYFTGLAIIGLFFVAVQYVAQAGWSVGFLRVGLAMGNWLPIAGILMFISFWLVRHDVFHWTHASLYGEHGDEILKGKAALWFWPMANGSAVPLFFILRMVIFFVLWYLMFTYIKREIFAEDINGGVDHWKKTRKYSVIFLVIFGFSSTVGAWDWVMSIDPHWFSTLFGWYVFASWWINGLAVITLITVVLKQHGYLKIINSNHLHDIGKFIFGFSIFWTYIWFAQFLLQYYANMPEETIYWAQRLEVPNYSWILFMNLFLNFVLPFLLLMTRDAKRQMSLVKLVCPIVIVGHWFDFYLMITPSTMKLEGAFGLTEIGMMMIFGVAFLFVTLTSLTKAPLFAKNHPMLDESLHHHI